MASPASSGSLEGSALLADLYRQLGGELIEMSSTGLDGNRLRLTSQGGLLITEEVYPQSQAHASVFPGPQPWLFVVQTGGIALDLDHGSKEIFLEASGDGPNVCLTTSMTVDVTVTQAPVLLSRIRLPLSCRWKPRGSSRCLRADLPLLVPMARTSFAAALHPPGEAVAKALADSLFGYVSEQIGIAGAQLSQELDPITQLIEFIAVSAHEDLGLVDLARAASISARRLQELTKDKFDLSPMELLRRERLKLLHRYLHDPRQQGVPLGTLLRRLHLSDTAKTREVFRAQFGALPSELRRASTDRAA